MKRTLSALVLSGAMLCSLAVPALAAESGGEDASVSVSQQEALPHSVLYYGTVTQVLRDETGAVDRLALTSEQDGDYLMNITGDTVWIDSGARKASDPSDLEVGEAVYVFRSPISTRSLPPQSNAYAVVRNIPQDAGSAMYHVIEAVTRTEDGVQLTTDNGGLFLFTDGETGLSAYDGGSASLSDLKAGDRVMAWYNAVMLSYPGQAYVNHLMVLPGEGKQESADPAPAAETGTTEAPAEGSQLSVVLEGDMALPVSGRYENGVAMVPVAALAQALGYQATYTPAQNGQPALVTVESDEFSVELSIGENQIIGVTKIQGAVGMTAPQDYGAAPYIQAPGTTWAPAQLFQLLGRTVRLSGATLEIDPVTAAPQAQTNQ